MVAGVGLSLLALVMVILFACRPDDPDLKIYRAAVAVCALGAACAFGSALGEYSAGCHGNGVRTVAFGGPLNISGYEIPARQKVLTQTLGTGPGIVVCGLALAAAALAAPVALMMPADRPMAEFQAGSKLMGAGIEKAPRSDQTVEGSSPATVRVTGHTPA